MIVKHEINTNIGHPANSDLETYLTEAISVTDQLVALQQAIVTYKSERDEDELLDAIDAAVSIWYSGLSIYAECRLSKYSVINKYLIRTLAYMNSLMSLLDKYSKTAMTPVEDDQADGLASFEALVKRCIAGITHFICYEFNLFDYTNALSEGEEKPDIDEIYYCVTSKSNKLDAANKAVELCALALQFKQKLDLFDEYPEKEAIFDSIMGPFGVDIDEELLTIELVDKLIAGELTAQELASLVSTVGDEGELEEPVQGHVMRTRGMESF